MNEIVVFVKEGKRGEKFLEVDCKTNKLDPQMKLSLLTHSDSWGFPIKE